MLDFTIFKPNNLYFKQIMSIAHLLTQQEYARICLSIWSNKIINEEFQSQVNKEESFLECVKLCCNKVEENF